MSTPPHPSIADLLAHEIETTTAQRFVVSKEAADVMDSLIGGAEPMALVHRLAFAPCTCGWVEFNSSTPGRVGIFWRDEDEGLRVIGVSSPTNHFPQSAMTRVYTRWPEDKETAELLNEYEEKQKQRHTSDESFDFAFKCIFHLLILSFFAFVMQPQMSAIRRLLPPIKLQNRATKTRSLAFAVIQPNQLS